MVSPPRLAAERAAFRYRGAPATVGPFDLRAAAGELHLVTGASGSGKSTLARLLCGLVPHLYRGELQGAVRVDGRPTHETPMWRLAEQVGLVGQNPAAQLLASTVRDEVAFGLRTLGLGAAEIAARGAAALAAAGLADLADRDPLTLSGGEQQRLVIAAIAARRPAALVLDEPLSMLDARAATAVVGQLDALRAAGAAVVVGEHRQAAFAGLADVHRHALPVAARTDADHALPDPPPVAPFRLHADKLRVARNGRALLRDVSLTLAGGEVVAVLGANGAGKTTLLRALAGLQPHDGRLTAVRDGAAPPPRLGVCFQNPDCQLFNPSVGAELRFGRTPDEARVASVLALLGLAAHEETPPLLLSEGEKKRLGVAIMLLQPGLSGLCLDEPTLGQDASGRRLLGRLARHLAAHGWLCAAATHDVEWAAAWADRFVLIERGALVASGPASALAGDLSLRARLGLPAPSGDPCPAERRSH